MSDPVKSFEMLLKKQGNKKCKTLYNNKKQQNKSVFTPQDVISNVSSQLKAIKVADTYISNRGTVKDLNKYKSSAYISVNKLPTYGEQLTHKQTTKFDTQCVTDTQLINVIEDAEIVDKYQGMTDVFETPFSQIDERNDMDRLVVKNMKSTSDLKNVDKNTDAFEQNIGQVSDNSEVSAHFDTKNISLIHKTSSNIDANNYITSDYVINDDDDMLHTDALNKVTKIDQVLDTGPIDTQVEQFSQILKTTNKSTNSKTASSKLKSIAEDENCSQIEVNSQILNQCQEIETDDDTDMPASLILPHNNTKVKSKTPSPLVFNLDKFEHFENIAISLLGSNDIDTVKHVINSQILDKELLIKVDEDVDLNVRNVESPVLHVKGIEERNLESPIIQMNKEVMTIDKATSEEILNQLTNKSKNKVDNSVDIFKDEILFSSDEEEDYVHKELQDLPFTCALETSFYDQSDVLDKTMYVGFQTASNRSIKISADSFVKAKSLLIDVTNDEITVTDLVKNCDNSLKYISKVEQTEVNDNVKEKEVRPNHELDDEEKTVDKSSLKLSNKEISKQSSTQKSTKNDNFMGFTTANNKKISLSEKALARCKKVFQDIDLSQNFDNIDEKEHLEELAVDAKTDQKNKPCDNDKNVENAKENINPIDDVLQGIDDVIMQEFENIEMSLEDDKPPDKENYPVGFKTASKKDIKISDVAMEKMKDIFKDIDVHNELNDNIAINKNQNIEDVILSQIISNPTLKDENNTNISIKTASNKNINISEEALAKSKKVFENIDSANKVDEHVVIDSIRTDFGLQSSNQTGFIGFKTANNKDIKISADALAKTNNIFKDIDIIEPVLKSDYKTVLNVKEYKRDTSELNINQPSTSQGFVGFKTANNKKINISEKAWDKSKNIFNDIDSTDLPKKSNKDYPKLDPNREDEVLENNTEDNNFVGFNTARKRNIPISKEALAKTKNIFSDIDSPDFVIRNKIRKQDIVTVENKSSPQGDNTTIKKTSMNFTGFKSASNKEIKISDKALVQTRDIFKDIESMNPEIATESLDTNKNSRQVEKITVPESEASYADQPSSTEVKFAGFKTANNKDIKISKEALARTKTLFNDVDSMAIELPNKKQKDYPNFEEFKEPYQSTEYNKQSCEKTENCTGSSKPKNNFDNLQEMPQGFKTASNKQVAVSKESLMKSKNIFKDIDESEMKPKLHGKGKDHYPNLREHHETKSDPGKEFKGKVDVIEDKKEVSQFQGFKTASNKQVKVSKEALIKSKNIFKYIDDHNSCEVTNKNTEVKDLYPKVFSYNDDAGDRPASSVFQGFQTANKKSVSVSAKALEQSKKIFEDNLQIGFSGFQTASNKQVKISEKALAKSRNIFKDIDHHNDCEATNKNTEEKDLYPKEFSNNDDAEDRPGSPVFQGFQTANKKTVSVSAKALEQSKKIFEGLQNTDRIGCSGFQTASNKQVKISEKALAKSRNIFKDIDNHEQTKPDNKLIKEKGLYPEEIYQNEPNFEKGDEKITFSGFQTGNNKVVNVTEKALTETKKLFDIDKRAHNSFQGFATASNKKVVVSEEALAKTKKIFQDIDTVNKKDDEMNSKAMNFNMSFQTGNSKPVSVSNDALARSKRLFAEIDDDVNTISNKRDKKEPPIKLQTNDEIQCLIDTQVINNFEESLYTEDFKETPKKSKRSGSPILSCPRAKKRKKFETPYNIKNLPKPIPKTVETAKDKNKLTFREDYKQNKKYKLKDMLNMTKNYTSAIDSNSLLFDFDNLLQMEFENNRNDLTSGIMTIDILKERFLNSVNAKLVPNGWLENHLKLIIWKLIYYEVKFRCLFCTARNVIDQLKYRYDRELYNAQRPALRKIYEKDDVPSKTMVLRVVGIYVDGVKVSSVPENPSNIELLLSDGWYSIRCIIDKMLTQLVCSQKIIVGSKIATSGAELTGCEQGVAPWEDTSSVRLKIFGNSTRRAHWDARLGYHGNGAILSPLSTVSVLGGKVAKLRVFVTRVYPALYVEKFEDGSTVTRSERLENLHQMKTEAERQNLMEKIYEEVETEFADKDSQDSEGLDSSRRPGLDSGSQVARMMKRSRDPAEFRAQLTDSQSRLLEAYTSRNRERLLQDIQTAVRERLAKSGVCVNRNVISLLKIRVAGVEEKADKAEVCRGMMSIWKPNECIREIVREGAWIDVLNVVPTAVRYSEIQISAGRQSIFSASKFKPPEKFQPYTKLLQRQCYSIKDLAQNPGMSTEYNEIDTAGLIFLIDPSIDLFDSTKQSFQNVYLTDTEKNIICINFWGGLKKFGFQNVLDTGQVVTCVNLQKRAGNTRKTIPQYRVTELSYFTQTPKSDAARKMLVDLNKKLQGLDRRKFCEEYVVIKNNYSIVKQNNENVSPYRFMNNSEINMSKNKVFIDSPLGRNNKIDDNFNLTGLDFESTFRQDSELSEEALKRKRKVNEKIAKLKMYGEPPPLSPLHIINRSKQATNSYKSPLLSNNSNSSPIIHSGNKKFSNGNSNLKSNDIDSSVNVANVTETPQKCGEFEEGSKSPVLNRTYVKSVNPVKINFDVKDNNDSTIDHFAEEFDGSPPLSLD